MNALYEQFTIRLDVTLPTNLLEIITFVREITSIHSYQPIIDAFVTNNRCYRAKKQRFIVD